MLRLSAILPSVLLALTCFSRVHSISSPVSGEYDCEAHDPFQGKSEPPNCLARLKQFPQEYEVCKNSICYLFLQEPPFIFLDPKQFNSSAEAIQLQKPFRCGDPASFHPSLGGIAFELHRVTSSRDYYCMWAGHGSNCTFNQLVDYTQIQADEGYQFGITGLLLETPQRQCHHEASAPLIDNSVIIIGRRNTESQKGQDALKQLIRPFNWATWLIFLLVVVVFVSVCFTIAVRFHVFRGRSLVTAFFIFTGERDEAMAYEAQTHASRHLVSPSKSSNHLYNISESSDIVFATKYGLSMTLYRIALVAFLGIFILFYEVAVVNFLFQQQSLFISQSVRALTAEELKKYSVLKGSALENVWNATVNSQENQKFEGDNVPWARCDSATQCVNWTESGRSDFDVTFEVVGKFLINEVSSCDNLTIFETQDVLYQFNGGWLYNSRVNDTDRKLIDRELISLRIDGTVRRFIEDEVGGFSCSSGLRADIGPMIILVPCLIFVFPPLLGSVLVLLLWKHTKRLGRSVHAGSVATSVSNHSDEVDEFPDVEMIEESDPISLEDGVEQSPSSTNNAAVSDSSESASWKSALG